MRGYDAWLTREPDYYGEPPLPSHCQHCGAFLPRDPIRVEDWSDTFHCDGSEELVDEEYTDGMIAIFGDEYRDKTYKLSVSPCGIDIGKHEPHDECVASGTKRFYVCSKCKRESMEVDC